MENMRRLSIDFNQLNFLKNRQPNTRKRISRRTTPAIRLEKSVQISTKKKVELKYLQLPKKQKKAVQIYKWISDFYHSNEEKLINMIKRQLKLKNYFYEKQLIQLITSSSYDHEIADKIDHELEIFIEFLMDFYERKKIKEILILEERIKEEEKFLEERMNSQQYRKVYKNLSLGRLSRTTFDLQEQYQNICTNYGRDDKIVHPHKQIKNAFQASTKNLYRIFEGKLSKKDKSQFIIKKSKRRSDF